MNIVMRVYSKIVSGLPADLQKPPRSGNPFKICLVVQFIKEV